MVVEFPNPPEHSKVCYTCLSCHKNSKEAPKGTRWLAVRSKEGEIVNCVHEECVLKTIKTWEKSQVLQGEFSKDSKTDLSFKPGRRLGIDDEIEKAYKAIVRASPSASQDT